MQNIFLYIKSIMLSLSTFGKFQIGDAYNIIFAAHEKSPTIRNIFRDVFGDDYLEDADPNSFISKRDLYNIIHYLKIKKGERIVDLACGRGGPGLWVARETNAKLTGIDISEVAIKIARSRISDFHLNEDVKFQIGSFEETGLPDSYFDAAMSIDALLLARDKNAAIKEIFRILRSGARFVFTNWESQLPFLIKDHISLLSNGGFEVEICEEVYDWKNRQIALSKSIIAKKNVLIEEMGRASAKVLIRDVSSVKYINHLRKVLVVAKKP
jgi:ubiquinone/menaquinone biosynthesis C-methylase UbiE